MPKARRGLGLAAGLCVVWAAVSVGLLSIERIAGLNLPGCGGGGGCAAAASGSWGSVPGIRWPVSHLGLAYYAAVLASWVATRGRLGAVGRWIVRLGAAISLLYVGVMVFGRLMCPYCISAHTGGLAFWILAERAQGSRTPASTFRGVPTGAAVLILCTAALAAAERVGRARIERDLARTTERLAQGGDARPQFTGRYRTGPEPAAVRIVAFTDYQCPDCRRVEGELRAAMAATPQASLSIKHFPFCAACNPKAPNLHPNACWAARAAEAAGILAGADGFWRMHHWLFDRGGSFTDQELASALPGLGFDPGKFLPVMMSPQTLALVQSDIEEGFSLGLASTPLIYINGVEVRGWHATDGVARAVRAAAEATARIPAQPVAPPADTPPSAREKHMADWREGPRIRVPPDAHPRTLGPPQAKVRVVVFGDYQEAFTVQADASLRALLATRADMRYEFRHFPVDQACNPAAPRTMHAAACLAARAAEVGAFLKGPDTFWAIHAWLMEHSATLSEPAILAAAPTFGFAPEVFAEAVKIEELAGAILDDVSAASALGVTSLPLIIINDRAVPRWKLGDEDLLPAIVAEAARE